MRQVAVPEGLRSGAALGACALVLAVIGLTPSFSWVPEVPLVGVAMLLPLVILGLTGFRVGRRTRRLLGGALAGAVAGAIGGAVGGVSYVLFGKSPMNIVVGVLVGAVGGAFVGAAGAQLAMRRRIEG